VRLRLQDVGEFGLIARLRAITERLDTRVHIGIGDDAAVVQGAGLIVMSADALVEGVHFRRDWSSLSGIGYRALAASLSDIAAMGAKPVYALVTLAVPETESVEALEDLYRGMMALADEHEVRIVGGDIVSTPGPLVLSVTVTGELVGAKPLLRSGVKPGDWIFVTGDLGGSGAFVHYRMHGKAVVLTPEDEWVLRLRHERPQPQVLAARMLAGLADRTGAATGCTALTDISDGLASELYELAETSGIHILLYGDRVPTPPAVRHYARAAGVDALQLALYGGEDFQLLGAVDPRYAGHLLAQMEASGVRTTVIGEAQESTGASAVDIRLRGQRMALQKGGYDHFERKG